MDGLQQPKIHLSLRVLPTSHAILINLSTRLSEWSHLKSSPMLRTMNHDLPCRICGLCFLLKRIRCFRWAFSAPGWGVCVTSCPCHAGSPSRQQGYRPVPIFSRLAHCFVRVQGSVSSTRQPWVVSMHDWWKTKPIDPLPTAMSRRTRRFLAKSSVSHKVSWTMWT